MLITLEGLGRRFGNQQVIKSLNFQFKEGQSYAVLGGNGSGKSTLIRMIYGALTPSSGKITYREQDAILKADEAPFYISLAGPYLELIEELTAREFLAFYSKFRLFLSDFGPEEILSFAYLQKSADKEIRNFSSGMKQRLRLALAFFTQSSLILLDEPTSNLDPAGVNWYKELIEKHRNQRTLIIGSNFDQNEMGFCDHLLELQAYR